MKFQLKNKDVFPVGTTVFISGRGVVGVVMPTGKKSLLFFIYNFLKERPCLLFG